MKQIISTCIVLLMVLKSIAGVGKVHRITYADTISLGILQKQQTDGNYFENLIKRIECNDANYEKEMKVLKKDIESQIVLTIKRLSAFKKDTMRSKPLIELFSKELKNYEKEIENEATILFWSYGVASMQGERVVSRNCYYLSALRRKLSFIKAMVEKIDGSLLFLEK